MININYNKFCNTPIMKHLLILFSFLFYINTEDSYIPGYPSFSGTNFESARNLYRSLGLDMNDRNIIKDYYGEGAHVYRVEWTPNISA